MGVFDAPWVDFAKLLSTLGFVGVTAFLLAERFYRQQVLDKLQSAVTGALEASASAQQRLADVIEQQSQMWERLSGELRDLRTEVRISSMGGRVQTSQSIRSARGASLEGVEDGTD